MRKILVSMLLVAAHCQAGDTNQPITFRHVKPDEVNNGHLSYGTVFWATNHTTNTLAVALAAIENKAGSNWVVQSRQVQPLAFDQPALGPHSAGYAMVKLSCQPTGTIWRAKVMVAPTLTGSSAVAARVRRYPYLLQERIQYGNTNIPLNPLATNMTMYGETTYVLSQEISEE